MTQLNSKKENKHKFYTQDIVMEQEIEGPIVTLKDGRQVAFAEIRPINFQNMDVAEQQALIANLCSWYKICPAKFQLKVITSRADAKVHIEHVLGDLNKESNREIVKLGRAYCDYVSQKTTTYALKKRFIFCFSDDGIEGRNKTKSELKNELRTIVYQCKEYFSQCGHRVINFTSSQEEQTYIQELLYSFYNPRSYETDTFENRFRKVKNDFQLRNPEMPEAHIPLSYVLAPKNIELNHKDYIVIDGMYRAYYYIPSDEYPMEVNAGWLGAIKTINGTNIDMYVKKATNLNDLQMRRNLASKELLTSKEGSAATRNLKIIKQSATYFQQAMEHEEDVFFFAIMFTLEAKTLNTLNKNRRDLTDYFKGRSMKLYPLTYQQEQAFQSSLYQNRLDPNIMRKASQNISTVSLCSLLPITSFEMSDPDGIFLGLNRNNASPVTYDPFDSTYHENANILFLGASGRGKTMGLLVLALRLRIRGIPVFIIAPAKANEFAPIANKCKGTFITLSDSSPDCINIMEIRPQNKEKEKLLSGESYKGLSLLAQKIDDLEVMLEMIFPSADENITQTYNNCCMRTYDKFGITHDNDSLFEDDRKTIIKPMPVLGDLVAEIDKVAVKDPKVRALANVMSRFTTGSSQRFNGQTNVDMTTKMVVIDVEHLSEKLKPFGMFIATSVVKSYIEEDRTQKKMLIIDEAWTMIGSESTPKTAQFVVRWCKTIRGLGGSITLAFQEISDLFAKDGGTYGKTILNACETVILLGMNPQQADETSKIMHLTSKEREKLVGQTKGQALLCTHDKVPIQIMVSNDELYAFTTDRHLQEEKLAMLESQKELEREIQHENNSGYEA